MSWNSEHSCSYFHWLATKPVSHLYFRSNEQIPHNHPRRDETPRKMERDAFCFFLSAWHLAACVEEAAAELAQGIFNYSGPFSPQWQDGFNRGHGELLSVRAAISGVAVTAEVSAFDKLTHPTWKSTPSLLLRRVFVHKNLVIVVFQMKITNPRKLTAQQWSWWATVRQRWRNFLTMSEMGRIHSEKCWELIDLCIGCAAFPIQRPRPGVMSHRDCSLIELRLPILDLTFKMKGLLSHKSLLSSGSN